MGMRALIHFDCVMLTGARSISITGGILGYSCITVYSIYPEWCNKEKNIEAVLEERKYLDDERH